MTTSPEHDSTESLARDVHEASHLVGSFVLRSGIVSSEYFDKYLFETDPELLRRVAIQMAELVPENTDKLGGLELGGIPLATMVSQVTGHKLLFIRKHAKEYGTKKIAEGGETAGQRIVLIEDVVTSGGAVLAAAEVLRHEGATVTDVVCAIDRQQGGVEALTEAGLQLHAALTRADLDIR